MNVECMANAMQIEYLTTDTETCVATRKLDTVSGSMERDVTKVEVL